MEVSFELTPDDYDPVRRIEKRPPWALILAGLVMLPSLAALWVGGFRYSVAVIGVLLALLIASGLKAAERMRKKKFVHHRCAPFTVRINDECLEVDGFIEWRRVHWSYLEDVEIKQGWLVVSFYEGESLLIPPRAWDESARTEFLEMAKAGIAAAEPRETATLANFTPFDDEETLPKAEYTIDESYMRQLVDLRFTDKGGFVRVVVVASFTAIACGIWKSMTRQIVAAGIAAGLPMIFMRVLELLMRRRALDRSKMSFELAMTLALHDEGYERSCRLFQSFTSWTLVSGVHISKPFVVISHSDDEHLLAPFSAWGEPGEILEFREAANALRESVERELAEVDEPDSASEDET